MMFSFLTFLAAVWSAQASAGTTPSVSVCEAISKRTIYNGSVIAIRGTIQGTPEGAWMIPSPDCDYKLVTKGIKWRNVIWLWYPNNGSPAAEDHATFAIEWKSIQREQQRVRALGFNAETDQIIATYVGRFVTYEDLESRVNANAGSEIKLGFGLLGEAPAQLLIKSVRDTIVVHRRSKPAHQ